MVDTSMLEWPVDKINNLQSQAQHGEDFHLVLEYSEGDTILGGKFTAPRSNRFYFVTDPNGGKMHQLEVYHKLIDDHYGDV